jgi:hypothetical protein
MAKAKAAASQEVITGYVMKTKQKGVPLQDCKIDKVGNKLIAKGHDGNGNKITTIVSAAKAELALEAGAASKGEGWAEAKKKK